MLIANGKNVKVVQELMRHASSRCALEIYSQARVAAKREAQQRLLQMIFSEELNSLEIPVLQAESDECPDWIQ